MAKGIPAKNFRKPFELPNNTTLNLSTVGLGTYLGTPDDQDDFDSYIALKYLLKSGTVNVVDTAINYRCQKSERTIGAVLKTLLNDQSKSDEPKISRDEIFIATKNGYLPNDADSGIPVSTLLETLKDQGELKDSDFAAGIHSMHPTFLEH